MSWLGVVARPRRRPGGHELCGRVSVEDAGVAHGPAAVLAAAHAVHRRLPGVRQPAGK